MRVLLLCVAVLAAATGPVWSQCSVVLGTGDYLSADLVSTFLSMLGPFDTICIAPGVYDLDPADGWPVVIPPGAPRIRGLEGAEATVLVGDGSMYAFLLADGALGSFSHLTFREFGEPIYLDDLLAETDLEFTDNVVEYFQRGLRVLQHYSVVSRNIFSHNTEWGLTVPAVYVTVEDNEVCYNGRGINATYAFILTGNHVHHNDDYGIHSSLGGNVAVIEYNLIEGNGGAGLVVGTAGGSDIQHNVIRGNSYGVQYYLTGGGRGSFNLNDLYANTLYDFKCESPGAGTVDATLNWWGTLDPLEIADHIFDCEDAPGETYCVNFDPWCENPGCDGGTPVESSSWGLIKALYR